MQQISAQKEANQAAAGPGQGIDCYKTVFGANSAGPFVEFVLTPHKRHGFAWAQLLHYTLEPNPAATDASEAPAERLTLDFSTADVVVLGWQLAKIADAVRDHKLQVVTAYGPRYAHLDAAKPFVAEIVIQPLDRPKAEPPEDFDDRPVINSLNPPGSGPGNTAPLPVEHSRSSGPHSARR